MYHIPIQYVSICWGYVSICWGSESPATPAIYYHLFVFTPGHQGFDPPSFPTSPWLGLSELISTIRHKLTDNRLKWVNRIAGFVLLGFGIGLIIEFGVRYNG